MNTPYERLKAGHIQDLELAIDRIENALLRAHMYGFRTGCLTEALLQLEGALNFVKYGEGEIPK
jgi:hypothetical protein